MSETEDVKLTKLPRDPGIFKRVGKTKTTYIATVRIGKKQRKKSCDTLREARAWKAEKENEAKAGTYVEPSKMTIGALLQRVIDADRGTLASSTLVAYADRMHQLQALHAIPVQRLTLAKAVEWQAEALTRYAKSTVCGAMQFLKKSMGFAVRMRLVSRNPLEELRIVAGEMKQDNVLTLAELTRLRAAWRTDPLMLFWEFLAETGARVGEASVIELRDLDLDAGIWRMRRRRTKTEARKIVTKDGAKTRSGVRDVRLSPELLALVRAHVQAMQDRRRFEPEYNAGDALFPGPKGRGTVRRWTIDATLSALCVKAGVPRITPHGLRHTSATIAVETGINPKVVAERIGHRDVATTLRRYVHPSVEEHEQAAKRLADRMSSGA